MTDVWSRLPLWLANRMGRSFRGRWGRAMGDLLFLAHRIPYPPDKGDKIRSWNILKYVAERAPVHLGAFVDDPEDMKHADFLASVCKSVKLIPMDPKDKLKRAFSGWRKGEALSISLFDDRAMKRWVWDRVKQHDIDRMFVFSSQMAPYALGHTSQGRRTVMDFVDIDSDKFAQYAKESRWPKSWLYAREAKLLQSFEKQVARHVDVSLFVSDAETAMFKADRRFLCAHGRYAAQRRRSRLLLAQRRLHSAWR